MHRREEATDEGRVVKTGASLCLRGHRRRIVAFDVGSAQAGCSADGAVTLAADYEMRFWRRDECVRVEQLAGALSPALPGTTGWCMSAMYRASRSLLCGLARYLPRSVQSVLCKRGLNGPACRIRRRVLSEELMMVTMRGPASALLSTGTEVWVI